MSYEQTFDRLLLAQESCLAAPLNGNSFLLWPEVSKFAGLEPAMPLPGFDRDSTEGNAPYPQAK